MNNTKVLLARQISASILAAAFFTVEVSATAQEVQHLSITRPGGFPGLPVMSGIEVTTNGLAVTWDGPSGYYQLYQALVVTNTVWQEVGSPNLARKATITTLHSNAFFKVLGPSPRYAGSQVCLECHEDIHDLQMNTKHAGAFSNQEFVAKGGQTDGSCLPCHTVGYGLPTGFSTNVPNTNPRLAGVQCESCHGPAAAHAANEMDLTVRPRAELAAQVCGGCHNTKYVPATNHAGISMAQYHPPNFEDWSLSAHREVLPDLGEDFEGNRGSTFYIPTCGRCHSGTVRKAHLENQYLPDGPEAAAIGITCGTCHDPHEKYEYTNTVARVSYTNQVRNPLFSLQDYHTTGNFTTNYNPNINICAQCHNDRGALWTSSDRPPHHSPQYNMLLGTVGVWPEGVSGGPAGHTGAYLIQDKYLVTNQCVTCHMQINKGAAVTGHKFVVDRYDACVDCHGSGANDQTVAAWRQFFSDQIQQVKASLDQWATNSTWSTNNSALSSKYATRVWEYTNPGDLSPGGTGPDASEQASIPDNIKKARFNLYLVLYDGSYGLHNGPHTLTLLTAAQNWVQEELSE
jgi:hypothetical protein